MTGYSRRNHYLPQAYLRRFCDETGRVHRTFLGPDGGLHEKRFVCKATGYEKDLYSLGRVGPTLPTQQIDSIETEVFGPIDRNGAHCLEQLVKSSPSELSTMEKEHWAVFVNSLLERHPQRLYERDRIAEKVAHERAEMFRSKLESPPQGRPHVLDLVDVETLGRNINRHHMVSEIQSPKTIDYLKGLMYIKLAIEPSPALYFVTGDNPVLVNAGAAWPIQFFTLAVTPNILLLALNLEQVPDLTTVLGLARLHNIELFSQCKFVFSKNRLEDNEWVKTRKAALLNLKTSMWKKG